MAVKEMNLLFGVAHKVELAARTNWAAEGLSGTELLLMRIYVYVEYSSFCELSEPF